jgi:hypothetical protein
MSGGEAEKKSNASSLASIRTLVDIDLEAVERTAVAIPAFNAETLIESGKTVFSTWMNVPAGTTKKLEAQYMNPTKITLGGEPIPYLFIFDKQSGAATSLDVLLEAPPGYIWAENNGRVFNYVTESPLRRVSLPLTLVKDPAATVTQP